MASLPPDTRRLAEAHRTRQQTLALLLAREISDLWARLSPANFSLRLTPSRSTSAMWRRIAPRVKTLMIAAQLEAARGTQDYVSAQLTLQGITPDPVGIVPARAFAGIASDGRDLDTLLSYPIFEVGAFVREGMPAAQALDIGERHLNRIAVTQVADAARVSTGVAITSDQKASGYVRMLTPPSCSRCVILAGRWYRWNAGFERHPQCFPAGVVVSGPTTLAATRRWYQGELTVIRTATGQELPATGNHPVLTDRGWLPANLLHEGDQVVRSTSSQGAAALVIPDEDQMPTRIEDCWRPNGVMPLLHMPTAAEDFHGDGGHGEVDVVLADRLLRHGPQSARRELAEQEQLTGRIAESLRLSNLGCMDEPFDRVLRSSYGGVSGGGLAESLRGGHAASTYTSCAGSVSDIDVGGFQSVPDDIAGHAVPLAQAVLALAGNVRRGDRVHRQDQMSPRWDAPADTFTMKSRVAYACRGQDLLLRLAGQIELDRVVEVRRVEWSGHVYNLTSSEGWYSANRLIVSNCDCVQIPTSENIAGDLTTSPTAYFDSLSEDEQNKTFTRAGADAVRDGADPSRVVNARRGMYTAGDRKLTHERAGKRVRPMPEQLYVDANGDRDAALRLLKRFGYVL